MEATNSAKIWEEDVVIPTYEIGTPDKNPMFLEKRVYQGSSGKVYPYPTIEKISHEKKDKIWHAVYLENEELLLTAQHIEQHRHATWRPNPYDSEAYYNLGLVLFCQDRKEEAYDAFYKAAWTNAQQEMSYYYLACIACGDGEYEHALKLVECSLVKNSHNIKARGLKAVLQRKLNHVEAAEKWRIENLELDAFDYVTLFENVLVEMGVDDRGEDQIYSSEKVFRERSRGFCETYLQTARDYAEYGCLEEAICILKSCIIQQPMIYYYQAYYQQIELLNQKVAALTRENKELKRKNEKLQKALKKQDLSFIKNL